MADRRIPLRVKHNLTLDPQIVEAAMRAAEQEVPPERRLSRIVDKALAEYAKGRQKRK